MQPRDRLGGRGKREEGWGFILLDHNLYRETEVGEEREEEGGGGRRDGDSACWITTSTDILLSTSIRKWGLSMWSWENPVFTREAESDWSIFSNIQLFLESHTVKADSFLFPGTPRQGESRRLRLPFLKTKI